MGYDIYRFKKGEVKEEFCCIICQDVLKDPKMINECEHIFCSSCIIEWISCKRICPIDRKPLTEQQLREPMRSFKSLLNQLEISCEFSSFGCNEFVKLDQLERHITNCAHNIRSVECVCGEKIVEKELEMHKQNCVIHLKREIDRIKISINDLKTKNTSAQLSPSNRLNSAVDPIGAFGRLLIPTQRNNSVKKTLFEEWIDCNRQYIVVKCEMNANLKSETIKLITDGLNAGTNAFITGIVDKLTEKHKGIWFGFIETIEYDEFSSYNYEKGSFLQLKVMSYHITLFKTFKNPMIEIIQKARTLKRPSISNNTMKNSMVETAITFSNEAIASNESFTEISNAIRQKFAEKFKNNWNCFAGNNNYGLSYVKKQNSSVSLGYNNMTVIIWQCP